MYKREAFQTLRELAKFYPVISITGPRQSGKTTLSRLAFPEKKYVTLEDMDQRSFAEADPKSFLSQSEDGLIIDEVQNCPELFSYIQGIVDKEDKLGQFILTGSQQFGLVDGSNQSLSGRVGMLELLPFSISEVSNDFVDLESVLFKGFYPPIYDRKIPPDLWYADYVRTYVERDVRKLINIKDLSLFQTFLRLCAARTGQLVNFSELSNAAGVDVKTVKSWLSVLEVSYIVFLLRPHHRNFSKKLVKTPKLYFYDVGLLTYLLRLRKEDMLLSPYRGHLFETMVISDFLKSNFNYRRNLNFYFWRDNKGVEVDLLFERALKLNVIEIKSSTTIKSDFFKNIRIYKKYAGPDFGKAFLVYGGTEEQRRSDTDVLSWKNFGEVLNDM